MISHTRKIVSVMTSESSGGAEYAAVNALDALSARGYETVLLTNQCHIVDGRGVRANRIDLGPKLSRASYRELALRAPKLALRLRAELEREWPYDILLVHYKKEQLLTALLPERLRAQLVWAEWGPIPQPMRHGPGRRAYLAAARRASAVLAVSAGTRDSICSVGVPAERVHIVPNAVRVEESKFSASGRARVRAELGIPPEAPVVGCVSRLHPRKRNDVAVDAVIQLARPDVHLIIAGEGETESDLREQASQLGGRAHFLPTPGNGIADVLSACDIALCCPSPTEGAPLAVIHAMLASRPCIATAAEGVDNLIVSGAGAITSPENDPGTLAAVLRDYLDDPARRTREGLRAQAVAERVYGSSTVGAQLERLLQLRPT
jgi:glycosyltransferase involved in cell wall biosynthesis